MKADFPEFPYKYAWRNNSKRVQLHGRRCRILHSFVACSSLVEFADGTLEVVSRRALRRPRQDIKESRED